MVRFVALAVLCISLSAAAAQQPAPAVTMDDIKKAWQERQDKVKTLKMSWTQTLTYPKGSLTERLYAASGKKPDGPQPPKDTTIDGVCDFVLSNDGKYSLEIRKSTWSAETQTLRPLHTRMFFDGKDHFAEMLSVGGAAHKTVMANNPRKSQGELRTIETYPVFWTYRGADEKFSANMLDEYELTGRTPSIQGVACIELCQKSRVASGTRSLYVDARRSFIPVSLFVRVENVPTLQLNIDYRPHDVSVWQPVAWSYSAHALDGKLRESLTATVKECVINAEVNASTFTPRLEPGTHYIDQRDQAGTQTVVKEDGTLGHNLPLRSELTYEEVKVLATRPELMWRQALIWTCLGVIVASVGFASYLRWKRRSSLPSA